MGSWKLLPSVMSLNLPEDGETTMRNNKKPVLSRFCFPTSVDDSVKMNSRLSPTRAFILKFLILPGKAPSSSYQKVSLRYAPQVHFHFIHHTPSIVPPSASALMAKITFSKMIFYLRINK